MYWREISRKICCDNLDDVIKDIPSDKSSIKFSGDGDKVKDNKVAGGSNVSDSNASTSESQFDENGLKAHNKFRDIHGSTHMKIDSTLSRDAELYAKKLGKIGNLEHAQLDNIGENLAYGCSPKDYYELTAAEVTKRW